MQTYNVYSIYDVKAQTYGNLFIAPSDGVAVRLVRQVIEFSGNTDYQRYPEDFALYCLASYIDSDGSILPCQPRLVTTFISCISEGRGAAVGGVSPLKSQSASDVVSSADAEKSIPACDVEDTAPFKAPTPEEC